MDIDIIEALSMKRFLTGRDRDEIVKRDGCCLACGFIEQRLHAIETDSGSFTTVCSECLAHEHPYASEASKYEIAYLPELSAAAVSHLGRVMAWANYIVKSGITPDIEALYNGVLPNSVTEDHMWNRTIKHKSHVDGIKDVKADVSTLRAMRSVKAAFDPIRTRIDVVNGLSCGKTHASIREHVGVDEFRRKFRAVLTTVSLSRVHSWGKESSFQFHPTNRSPDEPQSAQADVFGEYLTTLIEE